MCNETPNEEEKFYYNQFMERSKNRNPFLRLTDSLNRIKLRLSNFIWVLPFYNLDRSIRQTQFNCSIHDETHVILCFIWLGQLYKA